MLLRRILKLQSTCHICRRAFSQKILEDSAPDLESQGSSKRAVVFSGIQPTGSLHLGNYFGAVQLWKKLQDDPKNQLIISVVDMHAMTMPWNPAKLRSDVLQMFVELIACGLDPNKTILFQQSRVPEHAQLQWILTCYTTMARLDNLPQFNEKSAGLKEVSCGIFLYPVLQAADILLYKSQLVPVGEDQVQHLQLAAHLAKVFNNKHGAFFPTPRRLHAEVSRLKSLRNPTKKMSKSDPDRKSRIELADSPDDIREKLMKSVTDSESRIEFDQENRPQLASLLSLYQAVTGLSMEDILERVQPKNKVAFKKELASAVIEMLRPIQEKVQQNSQRIEEVERIVESGSLRAQEIARTTMKEVRDLVGLRSDLSGE